MLAAHGEFDQQLGALWLEPGVQGEMIAQLPIGGLRWRPNNLNLPDVDRMKQWIFNCRIEHEECRFEQEWYPDRLVLCEESGCRLVSKEELSEPYLPYVSLSHCWSPDTGNRTVLKQTDLESWRTSIPIYVLGQTLQDAIRVTMETGFQLVWIDSLCIIQDSSEDWLRQAPMMNEVYKNAAYNIAALDAKSDEEGFLFNCDPYVEFGFSAPFATILGRKVGERRVGPTFEGTSEQECVLLRDSTLTFSHSSEMGSASTCPLYKRGWVFQERNLARRILAFTRNGISWSCEHGTETEQGREFVRNTTLQTYRGQIENNTPSMGFKNAWEEIVREYSKCQLTRQSDKLIAVGALAREVSGKGEYLAGLWAADIWPQLGWRCQGWGFDTKAWLTPPREHLGSADYVAPSWSWASVSVGSKVSFYRRSKTKGVIIGYEIKYTGSEFGQIKSGWIRIFGQLNAISSLRVYKGKHPDPEALKIEAQDQGTGSGIAFDGDTVESYQIQPHQWRLLRWMPLTHEDVLVLMQVKTGPTGYEQQEGEDLAIYRRIGVGMLAAGGPDHAKLTSVDNQAASCQHFILI